MKKLSLILLVGILISCEPKPATEQVVEQTASVDRINEVLIESNFNGTGFVTYRDSTHYFIYGKADAESGRDLQLLDVFYLGSLAKQFTAMAIMMLVDEGKMDFEDPVTNFIGGLPIFCESITVRQMLNHTSGLPDYYGLGIFQPGMTNDRVVEAMQKLEALDFDPGSEYAYSNSAYVMLSVIVEKVSGQSFRDFLEENVFVPLEMEDSDVFDTTNPELSQGALGHTAEGEPDYYNAFTTGGGGIFSNVVDLQKWIESLDNRDLVHEDIYREAYTPARLTDNTLSYYGFGWRLSEDNPEIVQHSGSLAGFRTYMYRNRESGTVVLLLSNYTNNVSEITEEILTLLNE